MSTTTLDKATADALARLRVMAFATARQGGASKTEPLTVLGWTVSLRVTCDNPLNERTCVLNASAKTESADRAGLRVILDALGAPASNQTDSGGFYDPPRFSSWEGPAPGGLVTSVVTWRPFHDDTKIGRNDPCPCGSGKKWKKCCSP